MIKTLVKRNNLAHSLQRVQKIITSVKAESEVTGIVFVITKSGMEILGVSDSRYIKETIIIEKIESDIDTSFKVTTDFRKLSDVLAGVRDEEVEVHIEDQKLQIVGKSSKFTLPVAKKEIPNDTPEKMAPCLVDTKELQYLLKNTLFSSSSELSRPILSSVKVVPQNDGKSLFVTTDGFRLSLVKSTLSFDENQKIQIPLNFFRDVVSLVLDQSKKTTLYFTTDDKCVFEQDGLLVWTKMVTGDFPPYEKVLFPEYTLSLSCGRTALLDAAKVISVMSRDHSNIIIVDVNNEGLVVRTKKEVGGENTVALSLLASHGFDENVMTIAFNAKYLSDYLSTISDDSVTLRLNRADAPVLFLPGQIEHSVSAESCGLRHVIMPVRINE